MQDIKLVAAALVIAAEEESSSNPSFGARIQAAYQQLAHAPTAGRARTHKEPDPPLVPLRAVPEWDPNPALPPNPYHLHRLYGSEQLPRALKDYTSAKLKRSAKLVQQRNPGTAPEGKSDATKPALIAYIVEYVTKE